MDELNIELLQKLCSDDKMDVARVKTYERTQNKI